jgi:hypothetical protein
VRPNLTSFCVLQGWHKPQVVLSPQENTSKWSHNEKIHTIPSPNTIPISTVTRLRDERYEFNSLQGYEFFIFLPPTLWCRTIPGLREVYI